jgi:hypothetical protein
MPDVKKVEGWIADLRSGKYKQGRKWLHNNDCFCCLGVAADREGVEWVDCTDFDLEDNQKIFGYGVDFEVIYPDRIVDSDYGLSLIPDGDAFDALDALGAVSSRRSNYSSWLGVLNDEMGMTFSEIADLIENHLLRQVKENQNGS